MPPTDRCLDSNGQCHREAICTDLHFHGERAMERPPSVIFHLVPGASLRRGRGWENRGSRDSSPQLCLVFTIPFSPTCYTGKDEPVWHPSSAPTLGWLCHLHSDRGPTLQGADWETAHSQCCTDAPGTCYFADKTMGVFHLQSPRKKYDFTYEQAQRACAAEGASLATFRQLSAAQQVSRVGARRASRCKVTSGQTTSHSLGQALVSGSGLLPLRVAAPATSQTSRQRSLGLCHSGTVSGRFPHAVCLHVGASSASKGRSPGDSSGQPYQRRLCLLLSLVYVAGFSSPEGDQVMVAFIQ